MLKEAKGVVRRIKAQRSRTTITVPDGWIVRYDSSLRHIADETGDHIGNGTVWISQSMTAHSRISFDPLTKTVNILFDGDQMASDHEENWVRAEIKTTGTNYEGECSVCGNLRKLYPQNNFSGQTTCDDCLKDLEKKRQETAF
jgi:hypothetical protein